MPDSPSYGFNRNPQFSTNHLADYLAGQNATHRTRTIREAKFPRRGQVSAYAPVRTRLRNALTEPDFARDDLEFLVARLEAKERRETGQAQNNARLCALAVRRFQETFTARRFGRYTISTATRQISTRVSGVKLNVSLDATITQEDGEGSTMCGGIILHYAFSASRPPQIERQRAAAGLVLWALEGGQMEPLSRLCMSVDLADRHVERASASHERFRSRVSDSCAEVAARWDEIEPPHDYDGPDWH